MILIKEEGDRIFIEEAQVTAYSKSNLLKEKAAIEKRLEVINALLNAK